MFFLIIVLLVNIFLRRVIPKEDKVFISRVFWISIFVRLIFCLAIFVVFYLRGSGGWTFGDEWGISERAWQIAEFLRGAKRMMIEYPAGKWVTGESRNVYPRLLPLREYRKPSK